MSGKVLSRQEAEQEHLIRRVQGLAGPWSPGGRYEDPDLDRKAAEGRRLQEEGWTDYDGFGPFDPYTGKETRREYVPTSGWPLSGSNNGAGAGLPAGSGLGLCLAVVMGIGFVLALGMACGGLMR